MLLADIFAQFGRANRLSTTRDAGTAVYPAVPLTEKWWLGRNNPTTGRRSWTINHLAARYFSFVPGSSATCSTETSPFASSCRGTAPARR